MMKNLISAPAIFIAAVVVLIHSMPGRAADPRIEELVRLLGSDEFEERERAERALVDIGMPARETLRRAADSTDPEVARRARTCIPEIERNDSVLFVAKGLTSPKWADRVEAAEVLGRVGPDAHKAVPALMLVLLDENSRVRLQVARALGSMGSAARPAFPQLIRVLGKDECIEVREAVVRALRDIDVRDQQVIAALLEAANTDQALRPLAIGSLGKLGRDDERVYPVVLGALQYREISTRCMAAAALVDLRTRPAVTIPALVEFLKKSKNMHVDYERCCVASAFATFGSEAKLALPGLMEIVSDRTETEFVRVGAMTSVRAMEKDAAAAIPALKTVAEDAEFSSQLRHAALETIESIRDAR